MGSQSIELAVFSRILSRFRRCFQLESHPVARPPLPALPAFTCLYLYPGLTAINLCCLGNAPLSLSPTFHFSLLHFILLGCVPINVLNTRSWIAPLFAS